MIRNSLSFFLVITLLNANLASLFAVDKYFNFPEKSVKGSATFEKKRKICIFPFRFSHKEEKFQYLSKGLPSIIITELRNLDFIYVEYPHPEIIYHSFGPKPEKTLQELIDAQSEGYKKTKREIGSEDDLSKLREGGKTLSPEQDPRYIKVELKQIQEGKPPFAEDLYSVSAKHECDFLISGEYTASEQKINITLELFDVYEGKTQKFSQETSFIRAYQEMSPLGEKLRKALQGKETTLIQVETSGIESSLAYVDGVYLGKTPVTNKHFPVGKRDLFVYKEGYIPYKQSILLESGKSFYIDVKLIKILNSAFISVKSDEPESDVFLGITYLGKTPLNKVTIPSGQNRLRISKQGFIDIFRPVDAVDGEVSEFEVTMREGKSEIYYPNKQYVFLDHTYKDFATYSLFGTLFFYASYLYLNVASGKAIEAGRSQVAIVNASAIQSFYNGNPTEFLGWYSYQNTIINDAESRAQNYKRLAGTLPIENRRDRKLVGGPMIYGIGLMLVATVTFFVLGLDDESYDIGFIPYSAPGGGVSASSNGSPSHDSYSYFQYNLRY